MLTMRPDRLLSCFNQAKKVHRDMQADRCVVIRKHLDPFTTCIGCLWGLDIECIPFEGDSLNMTKKL